jgi:hypothetical protein
LFALCQFWRAAQDAGGLAGNLSRLRLAPPLQLAGLTPLVDQLANPPLGPR